MKTRLASLPPLAGSAILLLGLANAFGGPKLLLRLGEARPWPFLACALLSMLQIQLSATKWFHLARLLGIQSSSRDFVSATWLASTLNQFLPSSLLSEGQRFVWVKRDHPYRLVVLSQVLDRVSVHLVWVFALLLLLPWALPLALAGVKPALASPLLWGALSLGLCGALVILGWWYGRYLRVMLRPPVLARSLIINSLVPLGLYMAACSAGHRLQWRELLILSPLILMALSVPFFFSGWGLREVVLVAFASPLGLSREAALAVSLLYGSAGLLAAPIGLSLVFLAQAFGMPKSEKEDEMGWDGPQPRINGER